MPEQSSENTVLQEDNRVEKTPNEGVSLWKVAVPTLIIVIAGVFGVNYFATSNADYICTRVIETDGLCANGAWGDWHTVSSTTNGNVRTDTQEQVYTGTRILSRAIEYLNLRTSCADGFAQERAGSGSGHSGFHGGEVITTTQVCQITRSRSITTNVTTNEIVDETVGQVTGETFGDTFEETVALDSFDDVDGTLLQARRDAITLELTVDPNIVAPNSTVSVHWTSVEMTRCQVSANGNDDIWGSLINEEATVLVGDETSGLITQETVYTLKCLDFEGNEHEQSQTVRIIPTFQEI